jgi:uncharacterized protein
MMTTQPVPPAIPEPRDPGEPSEVPVAPGAPAEPAAPAQPPRRLELGDGEWHRVSPKYIIVDLIGTAIFGVVVVVAAVVLANLFQETWPWWVLGALLALILLGAVFTPRRIRSIGYQLRHDDLLFRRGIMWTRIVAVPYGRMQLIDINRGPVARAFGLAELKFVTASAATAIVLPGLPEAEAEGLRDHLVAVAESRRTGL